MREGGGSEAERRKGRRKRRDWQEGEEGESSIVTRP